MLYVEEEGGSRYVDVEKGGSCFEPLTGCGQP
jgi:hypothetical protein